MFPNALLIVISVVAQILTTDPDVPDSLSAVPGSSTTQDCSIATERVCPLADSVVSDALSYLGAPYVYGGTGPSGFDCSGLVCRVFEDNGITLPRTVSAIEALGEPVDRSELLPGDLLIFENPKHIGIYIGEDRFVHSSSYLDRGVVITELCQPNYQRRYSSAVRVLPHFAPASE
jgi:cell wall-associated NlpC family hydrolase